MQTFNETVKKIHQHFQEKIKNIRTGRANPGIISDIPVEAYGVKTPLSQISSISVSDARTLVVEPWDKSIIKDIEKSIIASNRNISPAADRTVIRVSFPELTEQTRKEIVKTLRDQLERSRVAVRKAREEAKKRIESDERSGKLTQDDKHDQIKNLDQATKDAIENLEQDASKKEQEIMTI